MVILCVTINIMNTRPIFSINIVLNIYFYNSDEEEDHELYKIWFLFPLINLSKFFDDLKNKTSNSLGNKLSLLKPFVRLSILYLWNFSLPPIFLKQWKFRGLSRSGIYFVRKNQRTFKTTKKRYSYDYMGDWYPVSFPTLLWKREPDKLILPSSPSRHMYLSRFSLK